MNLSPCQKLLQLVEKAWLPKPFLHDCEWAFCDALVNNPKLQTHLPVEHLPTDQIQTTQDVLDKQCVDKYAQTGKTNGGLVIRRNGINHLYDGHHRIAAAKQVGQDTFSTKVLALPNRSLSVDSLSKRANLDPRVVSQSMNVDDRRHYENR